MAQRNRANRLDSVIRIAEDEEKKAFADLGKCREEIQGQEQKLEELVEYREEYYQDVRQPGESAMIQRVQNRFAFLQKLEQAIDGQRKQVSAWGEQEARLQQVWMEKRIRCRALNKATEKRQAQQQREERQREQKQTDSLVQNQKN
ncbi:MAG: flagellar export protein FliJ [Gammaproteobacteria bacterium]|jgi:flagellar FliJ protein|nr:flagellar export protein FliJ [Gammaproteobacteria bacterium]MBT4607921.1 flagellar export protein FliJ [Thiotrichales bacterium]MBT3473578.1 flagellar export protein FliJ [Gammaproteobacteria bacterium]MBT3966518.1 flagellar export protein FliJ [Gammaproteobacteria bacterium]MBT4079108.1 flagellar export protein FliJ [Gammaproteobacteria bacterium]